MSVANRLGRNNHSSVGLSALQDCGLLVGWIVPALRRCGRNVQTAGFAPAIRAAVPSARFRWPAWRNIWSGLRSFTSTTCERPRLPGIELFSVVSMQCNVRHRRASRTDTQHRAPADFVAGWQSVPTRHASNTTVYSNSNGMPRDAYTSALHSLHLRVRLPCADRRSPNRRGLEKRVHVGMRYTCKVASRPC